MVLALCKCGIDMTDHSKYDGFHCGVDFDVEHFESLDEMYRFGHVFDAAGTKYRCGEFIRGYLCPRPRYHQDEGVPCGPLTGKKLWE